MRVPVLHNFALNFQNRPLDHQPSESNHFSESSGRPLFQPR
jgi:hypothetical protein